MSNMTATVVDVIHATPTACLPRLELSGKINYKAGQYILVMPTIEGKAVMKPYSISSSNGNNIELCIRRVGRVSNYMCGLKHGDKIDVMGPAGNFFLKPVGNDTVFAATGTGISSIHPMIQEIFEKGTGNEIWLFFGIRTEDEIIYRDYFESLAGRHKNFHFVPVLSRPAEGWQGERGHVQDALRKYIKIPGGMDIYICGVLAMVEEVAQIAEEMGFKKEKIYFEKYV